MTKSTPEKASSKTVVSVSPRVIACVVFALLLLFISSSAGAVNLRGRIDIKTNYGIFPMNSAKVEVCSKGMGGCQPFITGRDGMYYVKINPGPHVIKVNGENVQNPIDRELKYEFRIPNVRNYDIPPIVID